MITNPKRIALASTSSEALEMISDLLELPGFHVLASPKEAVAGLVELLKRYPVTRGAVFDLQIAATMLANDIKRIYTFNAADFEKLSELTVVVP